MISPEEFKSLFCVFPLVNSIDRQDENLSLNCLCELFGVHGLWQSCTTVEPLPHNTRELGSIGTSGVLCVEISRSPCICEGSFWALQLCPTPHLHISETLILSKGNSWRFKKIKSKCWKPNNLALTLCLKLLFFI